MFYSALKNLIFLSWLFLFNNISCFSLGVEQFMQNGHMSYRAGNYADSITNYTAVITMLEQSMDFLVSQRYECIAKKCPVCPEVPIDPNYPKAYYSRGLARSLYGDHYGAVRDLKKSRDIFKETKNYLDYQRTLAVLQNIE